MNLFLIIACILIFIFIIILPLIFYFKTEKKINNNKSEWNKIKEYGNEINNKTRKKN